MKHTIKYYIILKFTGIPIGRPITRVYTSLTKYNI